MRRDENVGRFLTLFSAVVLLVVPAGCADVTAQGDVTSLFAKAGVRARVTEVQATERSRCALLEMPLGRDDVDKLIEGLELSSSLQGFDDSRTQEIGAWVDEASAVYQHDFLPEQGLEVFAPLALEIYVSDRRPEILHLPNGSQFQYLILYWDPETGRALVQVSYAYG